jgi:hypothetical protein
VHEISNRRLGHVFSRIHRGIVGVCPWHPLPG